MRFVWLLIFMVPKVAWADGGFVSPELTDLAEPSQLALLCYDDEAQREELTLLVQFRDRGQQPLERLGWILALPSVAEADEGDEALFEELMTLTNPYQDDDPFGHGCLRRSKMGSDGGINEVEVVGHEQVGAYDITTVTSESSDALVAWMQERDFSLAPGARDVFDWYIDKGWVFLAIEIDLGVARAEGVLTPLRFTFETDAPVYPMKITSINASEEMYDDYYYGDPSLTEVLLYAVGSTQLDTDLYYARTEMVHSFERAALGDYPALKEALPKSGVLTKLRFHAEYEQMTEDVYLTRVETAALPFPRRTRLASTTTLLFSLGALGLVWRSRRRR